MAKRLSISLGNEFFEKLHSILIEYEITNKSDFIQERLRTGLDDFLKNNAINPQIDEVKQE